MRLAAALLVIASPILLYAQTSEPDLQAERAKANELYLKGDALDALPLYEDLAKRDPQNPTFAERHAMGILAKGATLKDPAEQKALLQQAYNELLRARSLGDNSNLATTQIENLKAALAAPSTNAAKTPPPGYRESRDPEVIASMQAGEAAFARGDFAAAFKSYTTAAAKDPAYYNAALFAGDAAFRMHDLKAAGDWFQKAIAIDPNRETAYRYWGDALMGSNQFAPALEEFANAIVAEPYSRSAWMGLQQWGQRSGQTLHPPPHRPAACQDAHTVAALTGCAKNSDDANIKALDQRGFLTDWAFLNAADAQIADEYPSYREQHRSELVSYILEVIAGR